MNEIEKNRKGREKSGWRGCGKRDQEQKKRWHICKHSCTYWCRVPDPGLLTLLCCQQLLVKTCVVCTLWFPGHIAPTVIGNSLKTEIRDVYSKSTKPVYRMHLFLSIPWKGNFTFRSIWMMRRCETVKLQTTTIRGCSAHFLQYLFIYADTVLLQLTVILLNCPSCRRFSPQTPQTCRSCHHKKHSCPLLSPGPTYCTTPHDG